MKTYQIWHKIKCWLHNEKPRIFFHEAEILFCFLGENVGFEQDGRGQEFLRPVVVLRKFNNEVFWAVPLTKTEKKNHPYYYVFSFKQNETSSAILSQLRLIDGKRLKYKIGNIPEADFLALKAKIRQLFA